MWKSPSHVLAYLGLLFNALVWGVSWWPFRAMDGAGLHALWATSLIYLVGALLFACLHRADLGAFFSNPWTAVLFLSSGINNAAFNWAITIGEVIRVVLLFYLMPMWVALFARILLGERIGWRQLGQILLALCGAVLVLRPESAQGLPIALIPLPSSLADWLGVLGGMTFALTTVLLRKTAQEPSWKGTLAMFGGGAVVAGLLAALLSAGGSIPVPDFSGSGAERWLPVAAVFGCALIVSNLSFQYGARRVASSTASLIMLNEILFATFSAIWIGNETLSVAKVGGLLCIVLAALLAVLGPDKAKPG